MSAASCNADKSAKVKMTLLAILPNWNSLDSVREAHSNLELAGLVFFALLVVAEAVAHNSKQEAKKHLFDSIGIWFFAIAVLCEIAGYWYGQRNDTLSEQVIVSLDAKSKEASTNASSALTKSSEAETKADAAEATSGKAVTESSSAMTIASGARLEADSFEADIKSAKQQATDAESHLADALQRAAEAESHLAEARQLAAKAAEGTAELTSRFSDRVLTDEQFVRIFRKLQPFSGQEFIISTYWETRETKNLTERIFALWTTAGWKHTPLPGGLMLMGGMSGIAASIDPKSVPQTKGAAEALVSALKTEGIEAKVSEEEFGGNPARNKIMITIGTKP